MDYLLKNTTLNITLESAVGTPLEIAAREAALREDVDLKLIKNMLREKRDQISDKELFRINQILHSGSTILEENFGVFVREELHKDIDLDSDYLAYLLGNCRSSKYET